MFGMFVAPEVKATITEIRSFLRANAGLSRDVVERQAIALAKIKDRTLHSVRVDGLKPDQLALILVSNVVGRELGSGVHHVYRGTLGLVGTDLRALWSKTITEMQRRGYYSDEKVAEDLRWIEGQIKNAG